MRQSVGKMPDNMNNLQKAKPSELAERHRNNAAQTFAQQAAAQHSVNDRKMKDILKWPPRSQVIAGWMFFIFGYGSFCLVGGWLDHFGYPYNNQTTALIVQSAALLIIGSLIIGWIFLVGLGTWRYACYGQDQRFKIGGVLVFLVLLAVQLVIVAGLTVAGLFVAMRCSGHHM